MQQGDTHTCATVAEVTDTVADGGDRLHYIMTR